MATSKSLLKQLNACKRRIAAERDKIRELIEEYESIADDCAEAAEDIERAALVSSLRQVPELATTLAGTCTRCHANPYRDGACFASDCSQENRHTAPPTSGDDDVRVQNFYSQAMRQLVEEGSRATQTTIRARAEQMHKAFLATPAQAGAELPAQAKYDELIYAVASKFPGETRHQTALRYIREREQPSNYGASCAKDREQ